MKGIKKRSLKHRFDEYCSVPQCFTIKEHHLVMVSTPISGQQAIRKAKQTQMVVANTMLTWTLNVWDPIKCHKRKKIKQFMFLSSQLDFDRLCRATSGRGSCWSVDLAPYHAAWLGHKQDYQVNRDMRIRHYSCQSNTQNNNNTNQAFCR